MVIEKLIVANGMFDEPFVAEMPGIKDFKGEVRHSHSYKDGKDFENKRILVVGGSFTGIEISADVSQHTSKVIHTFRKPFFLVSHFMKVSEEETIPVDFVLLRWMNIYG